MRQHYTECLSICTDVVVRALCGVVNRIAMWCGNMAPGIMTTRARIGKSSHGVGVGFGDCQARRQEEGERHLHLWKAGEKVE